MLADLRFHLSWLLISSCVAGWITSPPWANLTFTVSFGIGPIVADEAVEQPSLETGSSRV